VFQLLVIANVVPNSPILVTLMMEVMHFSKTSILARATRQNIPDGILHEELYPAGYDTVLFCVTSKKILFFIVTAVRFSDITYMRL
jgi:hypothetical protein